MNTQILSAIAALTLLFTVSACKSTPKRIAYNSLATTAKAVDLAMTTAGELYKVQRITEADKQDILVKYAKYQLAMNEAIVLLQFDYTAITPATVAELAASIVETVNQFTSAP